MSLLQAAISLANGAPIGAVLTNYAVGVVTAGVGGGIGTALGGGAIANAAGSMIASGIASKASGGKFMDGVKSAAIGMAVGAAATYAGNKIVAGLSAMGERKASSGAPEVSTGGETQTGSSGGSCSANPINIATGEKFLKFRDYEAKGASTLKFERYYSSYNHEKGALGAAWKHNFERSLRFAVTLEGQAFKVTSVREQGDDIAFVEMATDNHVRYQTVAEDRFETLEKTDFGYLLTLADNTQEIYNDQGQLLQVRALSGYVQTLVYSDAGLLERVEDSFGQSLTFLYNDQDTP